MNDQTTTIDTIKTIDLYKLLWGLQRTPRKIPTRAQADQAIETINALVAHAQRLERDQQPQPEVYVIVQEALVQAITDRDGNELPNTHIIDIDHVENNKCPICWTSLWDNTSDNCRVCGYDTTLVWDPDCGYSELIKAHREHHAKQQAPEHEPNEVAYKTAKDEREDD